MLFLISLISTLLMILFYKMINLNSPFSIYGLILLKSVVISIAWLSIYQAYKKLEISRVSPLRNLSPLLLVILSFIFLGEVASLINYLGITILIISAYLIELKSFSQFFQPFKFFKSKYFILILISLIGNSISAVLDKIILESINYYSLMFIFYLFLTIIFFIFLVIKKDYQSLKLCLKGKSIFLIFMITLSALLADFSYFMAVAIPNTLIILIIPLRRLSTFLSTIFGGKLFNEKNLLYKSTICLLMIFAILLISI